MTSPAISAKPRPMAPRKINADETMARFPAGTFDRIAAVLEPNETRTDLLRDAVERELKRRERAKKGEKQ